MKKGEMKMNAKQITAVLAVVAVLAAGVVGLGYAYTATTENADNDSEAAYLTLASTHNSASGTLFDKAFEDYEVTFDTVKTGNGDGQTEYKFAGTANKATGAEGKKYTIGDKDYYILGHDTLTVTSENITSVAKLDFTMKAVVSGTPATTGIDSTHYVYKVALVKATGANPEADLNSLEGKLVDYVTTLETDTDVGASINDLACGTIGTGVEYYVYLFVAQSDTQATAADQLPLTNVKFTFTATPDTSA